MSLASFAKRVAAWATSLLALGFCISAPAAESYSFAVVPQFEQRKLFAIWKPIVDELAKLSGLELRLVATLTVPEFERELARGGFDFVYANPYQIMREASRQAYIPLVRDNVPVRGIVVVKKDSPVRSPADLNGLTLAVPSPNAIGASLLIRADLEQLFKVKVELSNVKTHSSVYLHVANGLTAAGGGVEKTLAEQEAAVRDRLRVIYTTRDIPSHPVAAHPRIPLAIRAKLQKAFVELAATGQGKTLLAEVPMTELVSASPKDYRPMSEWGLEKYWVD